ncbi:MAG: class I SAM-dependent DNA methyltransferase [Bacilli bacterium]
MKRSKIISTIGEKYLTSNIENEEFSYGKALNKIGKNYTDYLTSDAKRVYKDLDIRFANDRLSILVETKQELNTGNLLDGLIQLQNYVNFEKELTNNKIVAILASTNKEEIYVWYYDNEMLDINSCSKQDRKIKKFEEYDNFFFGTKNDKISLIKNTYSLNELLHKKGINEKVRSQFVGTCLLALKNGLIYDGLSTQQIIVGIEEILKNLLDGDMNRAIKLTVLDEKVLKSQDIRELKKDDFVEVLNFINKKILPSINDKSIQGQDLLSLFFTTFNKYVGKADKNQAFSPDHIAHFMSKVVGVNRNSVVLDPCCGSGAFLVRAMTDALADCDDEKQRELVKKEHIYGIEAQDNAFGLSTTNMLIHGDGNSNIIKGSCFTEMKYLENKGINVVLMNPPYNGTSRYCDPDYTKNWKKDTKSDPSKGLHYVYYIASKIKSGKMAVLLPMPCAIGSNSDIKYFKKKMLEENTLDAVFSLPSEVFYPGASVVACCMIFNLGIRHDRPENKDTFFGYYKDDGLVKKKNIGRVEREPEIWSRIEKKWLDLYYSRQTEIGLSVTKKVTADDEWLAEAYMETDYSTLTDFDFQKTINEYLSYQIKIGDKNES